MFPNIFNNGVINQALPRFVVEVLWHTVTKSEQGSIENIGSGSNLYCNNEFIADIVA